MIKLELDNALDGVPEDIKNTDLPNPNTRDYYRDEAARICWVCGEIGAEMLDIVDRIMKYNIDDMGKPVEERKRILLLIDSPGGTVDVTNSIIAAMNISTTPIYTCVYCTAYSAAADILACGHKRFALPFMSVMFHAGSGIYQGTQSQIDSAKKFFDKVGKRMNDEVLSHVNFPQKITRKLKNEDIYFNEIECLEYGVIDKIIDTFDELF